MFRKLILFEITFVSLAAFFGWQLYGMWYMTKPNPAINLEGKHSEKILKPEPVKDIKRELPTKTFYEVVAKKNLFNSKREEKFEVKKKKAPPPPRPKVKKHEPKPRIVKKRRDTLALEGIVIFGNYTVALVKNVSKPREGVKRVKVGETIDVYKVESISKEQLTLKEEDGTEVVLTLYSEEKPGKRRHIKTKVAPSRPPRAVPKRNRPVPKKRPPISDPRQNIQGR